MQRITLGFLARLLGANAISAIITYLIVVPFDTIPVPRNALIRIVQILNFPVALAGTVLPFARGIDVLYDEGSTWCDFCPRNVVVWRQMRLSVAVYTLLLYLPALVRLVRRDRRHPSRE